MKLKLVICWFVLLVSGVASAQERNVVSYFEKHNQLNGPPSKAKGTVGNGTLIGGVIFPFSGANFCYFDTTSYLAGRAWTHQRVKNTLITSFKTLEKTAPSRRYMVMELSNQHGGKLAPHHTHQNGLSVDLMTPLVKNGKPYEQLDFLGASHYALNFDKLGKWEEDPSVSIDFEALAYQILITEKAAREQGLKIAKVILKVEYKALLFKGPYGQKLQQSSIYFVQQLKPITNALHDDHFHLDFEVL